MKELDIGEPLIEIIEMPDKEVPEFPEFRERLTPSGRRGLEVRIC